MLDMRGQLPQGPGAYLWRSFSTVKYIVLHHSGVDVDSSARQIALYHIGKYGWPGCGYHVVVRWDGTLEWANDWTTMSYHVARRNHECIGICCPGDYTSQLPRDAQLQAALHLARWLRQEFVPQAQIVGHRDISLPGYETACPGQLLAGSV